MNSASTSSVIGRLLLAAILATPLGALAAEWVVAGRVVGITDGDTLTLLDGSKVQHVIRLGGIDAPEKKQPFGPAAKEHLSRLAYDRRAEARCWKRDRYGREICNVLVGSRDVGLAMVQDGYAWHFKRFASEQSADDQAMYAQGEADARFARRGLWRDKDAVAPWDFRKKD